MTTKTEGLQGVQCTKSHIVSNNTFEYVRPSGAKVIRLHYTDIVEYLPDNAGIKLDSGGWRTPTTKARINDALPSGVSVYQDKGIWYIRNRSLWVVTFEDGMIVPMDGSSPVIKYADRKQKWREMRAKEIHKYIAKLRSIKKKTGNFPVPENGDCFICMAEPGMEFRDSKNNPTRNNDHILMHLKEQYVHGHLIYNALKWVGYRDEQMSFVYQAEWITPRAVRRYLKMRVGLA